MRLSVKGLRSLTSRKKSSRVGGPISTASEGVVMETLLSQVQRGSKRHDIEKHTQRETDVQPFSPEAASGSFGQDALDRPALLFLRRAGCKRCSPAVQCRLVLCALTSWTHHQE